MHSGQQMVWDESAAFLWFHRLLALHDEPTPEAPCVS